MNRRIGWIVLALTLLASGAQAQAPEHYRGALGFHDVDAPIGVRWWISDKLALDAGLGFGSDEFVPLDENLGHWALDVGLPIMLKSWDRVHFIVRPGIVYRSQEVITDPGPPILKDNDTSLTIQGELEAEVFLVDNVSISAAHGLAIVNTNFAGGGSATDWNTTGSNFTQVGFHVYLFGTQ
jgi:hypothetical protein